MDGWMDGYYIYYGWMDSVSRLLSPWYVRMYVCIYVCMYLYVRMYVYVQGTTGGDRDQLIKDMEASDIQAVIAPNMAKQIVAVQVWMDGGG